MTKHKYFWQRSYFVVSLVLFLLLAVQVSADSWQMVRTEQSGRTWRAVTYGGGQYVVVGDAWQVIYGGDGKTLIYTSPNGKTWTKRAVKWTSNLYGVTYGNGLYVAVGKNGLVISSPDGITWTERLPWETDGLSYTSVAYNGSDLFVAGGVFESNTSKPSVSATSPDGITWTRRNTGFHSYFDGMGYGAGKWVAAGNAGTAYYSSNGISWTRATLPGVVPEYNNKCVVYADGQFVLGGNLGQCYTSPDGVTWTKRTTSYNHLQGLTWTGSHYVACGDSNPPTPSYPVCSMIVASTNGSSWVRERTNTIRTLFATASSGSDVVCLGTKEVTLWNTTAGVGDGLGCLGTVPPTPTGDTITITSPTASSVWAPGSTYNITWRGSKKYTTVDIEYNNGSSWSVVVTGTADDGSFAWTVPNTPTKLAKIWIRGVADSGNATDYSDVFVISGTAPTQNTITILYPNGGETIPAGSQQAISWNATGNISTVDIEYSLDDKKTWHSIVAGTADDGNHVWNVPTTMATKCYIWMKGWGTSGNNTDYTDAAFIIGPGVIVTSPNGGENWTAGSTQNITWDVVGAVGSVKIDYSLNGGSSWVPVVSSTPNDGSYPWTLPINQSNLCLIRISEISGGKVSDNSNAVFAIGGEPSLLLDKSALNFSAIQGNADQSIQPINITNGGGGTLNWNATSDASWLTLNPGAGSGNGVLDVSANAAGLGTGKYTGTITITDSEAENSPLSIPVTLNVLGAGQDMAPFGTLATPLNGSVGITGSVAVTGWALDDIEVVSVKIYRQVNGELSYIGDAVFVEGARPDVEASYPEYPYNYRAGWGYMLLSNFMPDGPLILTAIATDTTGHEVELGTTTITLDNANAKNPFGAIDSPGQGATIAGNKYRNNGWALTPMPNKIPINGSTINVYLDGVAIGKATYNLYRSDIAQLFPGYANSNNSWGYFDIDTMDYSNGLHTISWSVADDKGNSEGIGSRYFKILNSSSKSAAGRSSLLTRNTNPEVENGLPLGSLKTPVTAVSCDSVMVKTGYSEAASSREITPFKPGILNVEMKETGRVEMALNLGQTSGLTGYMLVNNHRRPLPVGSTLDTQRGVFSWQAGPGFVGQYNLVFVATKNGKTIKKEIQVNVVPGSQK